MVQSDIVRPPHNSAKSRQCYCQSLLSEVGVRQGMDNNIQWEWISKFLCDAIANDMQKRGDIVLHHCNALISYISANTLPCPLIISSFPSLFRDDAVLFKDVLLFPSLSTKPSCPPLRFNPVRKLFNFVLETSLMKPGSASFLSHVMLAQCLCCSYSIYVDEPGKV